MIDTIDLMLGKGSMDLPVQLSGGSKIPAEWFFNDDPSMAALLSAHAGRSQMIACRTIKIRRRGQIVKAARRLILQRIED
jgi:hypothetical protein